MRQGYVSESLRFLNEVLDFSGDVLDVGVQERTVPLMEAFPDKRHYLFEPIREYFERIASNYAQIDHEIIEAAVADTSGSHFLMPVKKTRDEISHSYLVEKNQDGAREIKTVSLDDFCQARAVKPSILKIDVEGQFVPARILQGAKTILPKVDVIVIEMTVPQFGNRHALLADTHSLWDLADLSYYGDALWQFDAIYVRHDLLKTHRALCPMNNEPFDGTRWQAGFEPKKQ